MSKIQSKKPGEYDKHSLELWESMFGNFTTESAHNKIIDYKEFIRKINKYKESSSVIIKSVTLADTIMYHFEEYGYAAEHVFYELLERIESYYNLVTKEEDLVDYLEFVLNIDQKTFLELKEKSELETKEIRSFIDGEI